MSVADRYALVRRLFSAANAQEEMSWLNHNLTSSFWSLNPHDEHNNAIVAACNIPPNTVIDRSLVQVVSTTSVMNAIAQSSARPTWEAGKKATNAAVAIRRQYTYCAVVTRRDGTRSYSLRTQSKWHARHQLRLDDQ